MLRLRVSGVSVLHCVVTTALATTERDAQGIIVMNESPRRRSKDPLEGKTLQVILTELHEHFGWDGLARQLPINSFIDNPSIKSSLTFLRRTPWAREKIEKIYRSFVQGKLQQDGDTTET